MLIGIDASRTTAGRRTGTEGYAYQLIQAIIPLAEEQGHQIRLYFNRPPIDNFRSTPNAENVAIPFPRLWTHIRLAWELHRRPPDVFFTPAHVIPFTYRRPCVATVHDLGYHHFPLAHTLPQVFYLRWSTRHNARRGRRVIADSEATKEDLIRFDHIDPGKIEVIYPGADPGMRPVLDRQQIAAVCEKYGISSPYLLYLGTLQPRKNLARLVEAFTASGLEERLVLAGQRGWMANSLLTLIQNQEPATRKRIVTPGFIAYEDKAALISGAQALLLPSLYEGFGFPVLEGNACGTPVLCSNTSSLPEVAGDAALFVDPLDAAELAAALRQIVDDDSLRQELKQAGLKNVQRFTWQRAATDVLHTLELATG
jgi:glycosyltransferase involved in cell wall biosynthesis